MAENNRIQFKFSQETIAAFGNEDYARQVEESVNETLEQAYAALGDRNKSLEVQGWINKRIADVEIVSNYEQTPELAALESFQFYFKTQTLLSDYLDLENLHGLKDNADALAEREDFLSMGDRPLSDVSSMSQPELFALQTQLDCYTKIRNAQDFEQFKHASQELFTDTSSSFYQDGPEDYIENLESRVSKTTSLLEDLQSKENMTVKDLAEANVLTEHLMDAQARLQIVEIMQSEEALAAKAADGIEGYWHKIQNIILDASEEAETPEQAAALNKLMDISQELKPESISFDYTRFGYKTASPDESLTNQRDLSSDADWLKAVATFYGQRDKAFTTRESPLFENTISDEQLESLQNGVIPEDMNENQLEDLSNWGAGVARYFTMNTAASMDIAMNFEQKYGGEGSEAAIAFQRMRDTYDNLGYVNNVRATAETVTAIALDPINWGAAALGAVSGGVGGAALRAGAEGAKQGLRYTIGRLVQGTVMRNALTKVTAAGYAEGLAGGLIQSTSEQITELASGKITDFSYGRLFMDSQLEAVMGSGFSTGGHLISRRLSRGASADPDPAARQDSGETTSSQDAAPDSLDPAVTTATMTPVTQAQADNVTLDFNITRHADDAPSETIETTAPKTDASDSALVQDNGGNTAVLSEAERSAALEGTETAMTDVMPADKPDSIQAPANGSIAVKNDNIDAESAKAVVNGSPHPANDIDAIGQGDGTIITADSTIGAGSGLASAQFNGTAANDLVTMSVQGPDNPHPAATGPTGSTDTATSTSNSSGTNTGSNSDASSADAEPKAEDLTLSVSGSTTGRMDNGTSADPHPDADEINAQSAAEPANARTNPETTTSASPHPEAGSGSKAATSADTATTERTASPHPQGSGSAAFMSAAVEGLGRQPGNPQVNFAPEIGSGGASGARNTAPPEPDDGYLKSLLQGKQDWWKDDDLLYLVQAEIEADLGEGKNWTSHPFIRQTRIHLAQQGDMEDARKLTAMSEEAVKQAERRAAYERARGHGNENSSGHSNTNTSANTEQSTQQDDPTGQSTQQDGPTGQGKGSGRAEQENAKDSVDYPTIKMVYPPKPTLPWSNRLINWENRWHARSLNPLTGFTKFMQNIKSAPFNPEPIMAPVVEEVDHMFLELGLSDDLYKLVKDVRELGSQELYDHPDMPQKIRDRVSQFSVEHAEDFAHLEKEVKRLREHVDNKYVTQTQYNEAIKEYKNGQREHHPRHDLRIVVNDDPDGAGGYIMLHEEHKQILLDYMDHIASFARSMREPDLGKEGAYLGRALENPDPTDPSLRQKISNSVNKLDELSYNIHIRLASKGLIKKQDNIRLSESEKEAPGKLKFSAEVVESQIRGMTEGYFNPHPRARARTTSPKNIEHTWQKLEEMYKKYMGDSKDPSWDVDKSNEFAQDLMTIYDEGYEQEALYALRFLMMRRGNEGMKTFPSDFAAKLRNDKRYSADPHFTYWADKAIEVGNVTKAAGASKFPWDPGRKPQQHYAGESYFLRYARRFRGEGMIAKPGQITGMKTAYENVLKGFWYMLGSNGTKPRDNMPEGTLYRTISPVWGNDEVSIFKPKTWFGSNVARIPLRTAGLPFTIAKHAALFTLRSGTIRNTLIGLTVGGAVLGTGEELSEEFDAFGENQTYMRGLFKSDDTGNIMFRSIDGEYYHIDAGSRLLSIPIWAGDQVLIKPFNVAATAYKHIGDTVLPDNWLGGVPNDINLEVFGALENTDLNNTFGSTLGGPIQWNAWLLGDRLDQAAPTLTSVAKEIRAYDFAAETPSVSAVFEELKGTLDPDEYSLIEPLRAQVEIVSQFDQQQISDESLVGHLALQAM